jgi:hypothetical protein
MELGWTPDFLKKTSGSGAIEEGPFVLAGRFEPALARNLLPPPQRLLAPRFHIPDGATRVAGCGGPDHASGVKDSAHARRVRLLSRFRSFFSSPPGRWSGISRFVGLDSYAIHMQRKILASHGRRILLCSALVQLVASGKYQDGPTEWSRNDVWVVNQMFLSLSDSSKLVIPFQKYRCYIFIDKIVALLINWPEYTTSLDTDGHLDEIIQNIM